MDIITSFISILGILCLGIMSPGPSFVLVARASVALSRENGLATALGMGVGGTLFAILALLGLQTVLLSVPTLYMALKILGGAYLVYLALQIWRGAKHSLELEGDSTARAIGFYESFKVGLIAQLSNPKTAIFYGSVFAALLPPNISTTALLLLVPIIFTLEAGWYSVVALLLSSAAPRKAYLKLKTAIDRIAGAIIGALGLKLIVDASST